jgi:hypothetical protein
LRKIDIDGHQEQVLPAGQQLVDRGELAGDADRGTHRVSLGRHVVAVDADLARIGVDERGEDLHGSSLARPVGTEHRIHRALGDGDVDTVEHHLVSERFAEAESRNGRPALTVVHGLPS